MLLGGCRLVQLRCKGWARDDVLHAARELVARCRSVGATFIVNDDPSVAAEVSAHGVHLGQGDGPIAVARALLPPGALVGRSTGDLAQLAQAMAEADYVAFGPIWETSNLSQQKPVRGTDLLREARRAVTRDVPLVAIGGITATRVGEVRAAGANAWAVISGIARAPDPTLAVRAYL
jgi:thiamine-phosphate pyrophosphorylase